MAGKADWEVIYLGLEPQKATKHEGQGKPAAYWEQEQAIAGRPGALYQWELLQKSSWPSARLHL